MLLWHNLASDALSPARNRDRVARVLSSDTMTGMIQRRIFGVLSRNAIVRISSNYVQTLFTYCGKITRKRYDM